MTKRKPPELKKKVGRPSRYKPKYAKQAAQLCERFAAVDADLADFFDVSIVTINAWKLRYPEFLESISGSKEIADARVRDSLFDRAVGYSYDALKILGSGDKIPYREHIPPDITAATFWLKNRQPELWRDRHEHTVGGTVVQKTSEEIRKEFVQFVLENNLLEELYGLLPPKLLEGVANKRDD